MPWYKFESKDAFNIWHEALKNELGYPLASVDQDGNEIGEPYTTDYTLSYEVADDDIRAMIEIEHGKGLTESKSPFTRRNENDETMA